MRAAGRTRSRKTVTSPPHFIPSSSDSGASRGSGSAASPAVVSANRRSPDAPPSFRSRTASWMTTASSGPPPTVPAMLPSGATIIFAPASRGVDRDVAVTVQSTNGSRAALLRAASSNSSASVRFIRSGKCSAARAAKPGGRRASAAQVGLAASHRRAYKAQVNDLAVVCDFDGTATVLDIGDEISRHFCGSDHLALQKQLFLDGELTTRGIIQSIYTPVTASETEVVSFALGVAKLRDGFLDLVAAARDRGAPFVLASGGLRQYVEAVVTRFLPPDLRAHVQVRANEAVFSPDGLRVTYPTDPESRAAGCDVCGSCKRVAVAEARRGGARYVLGIGDGF